MRAGRHISLEALHWPSVLPKGGMVVWPQACAEPAALTRSLMAARHDIGGFRAGIGLSLSDTPRPDHADCIEFVSYCGSGTNNRLSRADKLGIIPVPYSALADALDPVDVLLLQVAPLDAPGTYAPGLALEYLAPLIDQAACVIAQVNADLPQIRSATPLRDTDFDLLIHHDEPPLELASQVPGEVENRIAAHIAGLVADGATVQAGLGKLPETIIASLVDRRDLGVHSGAIGDWAVTLTDAGALTNARKPRDTGVSVCGLILGSHRLFAFADRNPAIRLAETSYTHDPEILASLPKYTAINSAIEVDLTGQINAEVAGGIYVGAVGGAADFLRGASRSHGGLPIVALGSTVSKTRASRIVSCLSGPVSTPRSEAGLIVTEHGIADLRGKTMSQRRDLMIAIAAPEHRAALDARPPHPNPLSNSSSWRRPDKA